MPAPPVSLPTPWLGQRWSALEFTVGAVAELFNRWQYQLWHGEVFPVVSQQGQIVMEGDRGNGGICQRKGMPLPAPLIKSCR